MQTTTHCEKARRSGKVNASKRHLERIKGWISKIKIKIQEHEREVHSHNRNSPNKNKIMKRKGIFKELGNDIFPDL